MTTGTDPMLDVHPVLAGFIYRLLEPTDFIVVEVRKPGKAVGGTWRFLLSNGAWLSAWYGAGRDGCFWHAHVGCSPVRGVTETNLGYPGALDWLRDEILKGGC